MTTVNTDIDTLASEPEAITLVSGTEVNIERLKTRQLMSLMKILTRGMGPSISGLMSSQDSTTEQFTAQLLGGVLISIPEAEEETIDFVKKMVSPAKLIEDPRSPQEKESNIDQFDRLFRELDNPELEDLLSICERIVKNEAPHIQALGKRLSGLLKVQQIATVAKQGGSSRSAKKS